MQKDGCWSLSLTTLHFVTTKIENPQATDHHINIDAQQMVAVHYTITKHAYFPTGAPSGGATATPIHKSISWAKN